MKFYGRVEEISLLRKARETSLRFSQFTVVTGRRRVGKTEIIKQALNEKHPEKRNLRRRCAGLSLKDM